MFLDFVKSEKKKSDKQRVAEEKETKKKHQD